jgi:hypothetical protein
MRVFGGALPGQKLEQTLNSDVENEYSREAGTHRLCVHTIIYYKALQCV